MRSPTTALIWDIWLRHRTLILGLVAVTVFTCVFNAALPQSLQMWKDSTPETFDASDAVEVLDFMLILAALLLFLAICGYTELNAQKGSIGFPHRLFVLPLSSFQLVTLPTF